MAQALCERHHFSNRPQFLQLKETFEAFWNNGIVPVVNENDLVSNVELKFSDNDELATLIAIGFNAQSLIICTSAGGFLNDKKEIIPVVGKIDSTVIGLCKKRQKQPWTRGNGFQAYFYQIGRITGHPGNYLRPFRHQSFY